MVGENLRKRLVDVLFGKRNGTVEVAAVPRHRRQVDSELEELLGQLPRAVGPEVEEDRAVAVGVEHGAVGDMHGLDELVGDLALVARADDRKRV